MCRKVTWQDPLYGEPGPCQSAGTGKRSLARRRRLCYTRAMREQLQAIYTRLYGHFGPQHWWPADSPFEVILGAILTQNTAWTNVEKALANLRAANAISPEAVRKISITELEHMLRPAGYFRQKSVRLKRFVAWLDEHYAGSL